MNLNQDLIEWLRTTNADEKNNLNTSDGTGLLLAPMGDVYVPEILHSEEVKEPLPKVEQTIQELNEIKNTLQDIKETIEEPQTEIKPEVKNLSEWHEAATKFDLSLDEPPIELWTEISESIEEDDDDYYEQSMSLQGDAYIQLPTEHGKNFTQRLQQTLKTRQQKAEILREEEEKARQKNHPYFFKALIFCSCMIIEIALMCFLLFALNRYSFMKKIETEEQPLIHEIEVEETNNTEEEQIEQIEQEEQIKQEEQEEKHEIEIMLPNLETKNENDEGDIENISEDNIITNSDDVKIESDDVIEEIPLTFEDLLRKANNAYNSGNHDMAVLIFHSAMESNSNDIRPYMGLARSYGAKKMYSDSKRIIDRARMKFGKDPTLETELQNLLKESKLNHERKRYKGK